MKKHHIGTRLDEFLEQEELLAETQLVAIKRLISLELQSVIDNQKMTKTSLAQKMGTSRAALERILNPLNTSMTLNTLDAAARAIGKRLRLSLI